MKEPVLLEADDVCLGQDFVHVELIWPEALNVAGGNIDYVGAVERLVAPFFDWGLLVASSLWFNEKLLAA